MAMAMVSSDGECNMVVVVVVVMGVVMMSNAVVTTTSTMALLRSGDKITGCSRE